jgi:hypothetical protein
MRGVQLNSVRHEEGTTGSDGQDTPHASHAGSGRLAAIFAAQTRAVLFSTDSFQLMKGADAAAVIGAVMSGENNLGAEDDVGIAGENNLRKRECAFR